MPGTTSTRGNGRSSTGLAIVFGGCVAMFATVCASSAWAGNDGDGSAMTEVLQLLGVNPSSGGYHAAINYDPRPPLVLPKKMTLPPPEPRPSTRAADWPQDPDVLRERRAEAAARAPRGPLGLDTGMTKQQELKQRNIPISPGGPAACGEFSGRTCDPHKIWAALSVKRQKQSDPDYEPGVAPPRKYLTQPPSRYMVPTKIVRPTIPQQINPNAGQNPAKYFRDQERRQQLD